MNATVLTVETAKEKAIRLIRWMRLCIDAGEFAAAREISLEARRAVLTAIDLDNPETLELEF